MLYQLFVRLYEQNRLLINGFKEDRLYTVQIFVQYMLFWTVANSRQLKCNYTRGFFLRINLFLNPHAVLLPWPFRRGLRPV